jgi:hypothetical protein
LTALATGVAVAVSLSRHSVRLVDFVPALLAAVAIGVWLVTLTASAGTTPGGTGFNSGF